MPPDPEPVTPGIRVAQLLLVMAAAVLEVEARGEEASELEWVDRVVDTAKGSPDVAVWREKFGDKFGSGLDLAFRTLASAVAVFREIVK